MKIIKNPFHQPLLVNQLTPFSKKTQELVRSYHKSWPGYQASPLVALDQLATELSVGRLYIKDESSRFGLNAFKGLGASYALGQYLAKMLDLDPSQLSLETIKKELAGRPSITFATATDGNHGKSLAWAAKILGQKSVVYMPADSSPARLQAIKDQGAFVKMTEVNYDDTVELIAKEAEEKGWVLVQDTAWEGYQELPQAIMQGYTTMSHEISEQLGDRLQGVSHIVLQAGVGSFAAAVASGLLVYFDQENYPKIIIVEPDIANPLFLSIQEGEGEAVTVKGDLATIMAGLACGRPNPDAWDILKAVTDHFISMPDQAARLGMRMLANPLLGDAAIVAGESGAAGFGSIMQVLQDESYRKALSIDEDACLLFFNTEGDTDPDHYRQVL